MVQGLFPTEDSIYAQLLLLKAAGRPARNIVDGGAFRGDVTARYLDLFPEAQIWAFEPTPEMVEELLARFYIEPRVTVVATALGATDGRAFLELNDAPATNSLLPLDTPAKDYMDYPVTTVGRVEIDVVSLDSFCRSRGIESLEAVKLDVQGSEHEVIEGAGDLLRRSGIDLFFTEMNFVPSYVKQTEAWSLLEELAGFDYRLYDLYGPRRSPEGQLKWCDGIFTSPTLRRLTGI